ncbi:MAG: 3-hydroxyacyl-CoA dehydrogenase NAD-binding domain-containing protein [Sphingobacterium sp.]
MRCSTEGTKPVQLEMDNKLNYHEIMEIKRLDNGIYQLLLQNSSDQSQVFDQDLFYHCLTAQKEILAREDCSGIYFRLSGAFRAQDYKTKIRNAQSKNFADLRAKMLALTRELYAVNKPRVVAFDQLYAGDAVSFLLQFDHRIAIGEGAGLSFLDHAYGLMHGWGTFPRILERVAAKYYPSILLSGSSFRNQELLLCGLADICLSDWNAATIEGSRYAELHPKKTWTLGKEVEEGEEILRDRLEDSSLYGRILRGLLEDIRNCTIATLLTREQAAYLRLLKADETTARLRVSYFGIRDAAQVGDQTKSNFQLDKVTVLGAGMMGAGIAYQAAKSELQVVLKDVTLAQAEKGKKQAEKIAQRLVARGRMQEASVKTLLARIQPTDQMSDVESSSLIIEAVYEDRELKASVIRAAGKHLSSNGIFASNTTSLPISDLAANFIDHERILGLHFFSPVDRMPLVEVIRGRATSEETLSKALSFVDRLGKVPIVVNDGPGFFTSRIFFNYLLEGISMLLEGIPIHQIEESAKQAGLAVGPLAVLDEISLPLMLRVYAQFPRLNSSQQRVYNHLEKMITLGRSGRRVGKGFYDYAEDRSKQYWIDPDLPSGVNRCANEQIGFRLMGVMALDGFRCLEEGVLQSPIDGDIGVVLGLGYPAYTGGIFGFMDLIGLQNFVRTCEEFSTCGDQWSIPASLKELADNDEQFYNEFDPNWMPN